MERHNCLMTSQKHWIQNRPFLQPILENPQNVYCVKLFWARFIFPQNGAFNYLIAVDKLLSQLKHSNNSRKTWTIVPTVCRKAWTFFMYVNVNLLFYVCTVIASALLWINALKCLLFWPQTMRCVDITHVSDPGLSDGTEQIHSTCTSHYCRLAAYSLIDLRCNSSMKQKAKISKALWTGP